VSVPAPPFKTSAKVATAAVPESSASNVSSPPLPVKRLTPVVNVNVRGAFSAAAASAATLSAAALAAAAAASAAAVSAAAFAAAAAASAAAIVAAAAKSPPVEPDFCDKAKASVVFVLNAVA